MKQRKLWVPVALLVVGICLTSLAFHYGVQAVTKPIAVDESMYTKATHTIDESISSVEIIAGSVDTIEVYFTQDEQPRLELEGRLDALSVDVAQGKVSLTMARHWCIGFFNACKRDAMKRIALYLPLADMSMVSVDAVAYSAHIKADKTVNINTLSLKAVDANLSLYNITSSVRMDGVDLNATATGLSGDLTMNGVDLVAEIYTSNDGLRVNLEGVDTTVTLHDPTSYHARLDGVSSSIVDKKHHVFKERSFGTLEYRHGDTSKRIDVRLQGVDQRLNVK